MARILAIDYGMKRTGIAITDEMQMIASGLTTVETPKLIDFLKKYFNDEKVELVIVGEPKQMNYEPSQSAAMIDAFVVKFTKIFPEMKVERVDERFTSKMALSSMIQSGMTKKKRQNKAILDEISATIILQDYLNYRKI
ncbi:Holliday junction resolvase RuvX [Flavobacterium ardleyense]|uniref:Holliday junction resolvase RuvX n=1 Tax=Flavobacterium ardleyense TaxID=2038737 RepID=UPI00298BE006|nr:Holliday junction resolvase RuvX [Flavobacterium ardleyense]